MKKTLFTTLAVALGLLAVASCTGKKDYVCTCTWMLGGKADTARIPIHDTPDGAAGYCAGEEAYTAADSSVPATDVHCSL